MRRPPFFVIFLAISILGITLAAAQTHTSTASFIDNAFVGNKFEIISSQLAVDKSSSNEVKTIARKIINDHRTLATDLKTAVTVASLEMPEDQLDLRHEQIFNNLKEVTGDDFDIAYLNSQLDVHDATIALFEDYSKYGDVKSLKEYASDSLAIIKQHREHVEKVKASIKK